MMSWTAESSLLAAYRPWTRERSPCSRATLSRSSETCCSRPRRSRLRTVVSPRIDRELLLEPGEEPREVLLRPLERRRLPHLVEDEEQDDRPEAAAHHVEERQAEDLERPPLPPPHGQALDGVMKEPRLAMASFQKAGVAMGSPSIGKRMTLTGTPRGSSSSARSKWRRRSLPETVRRPGGVLPLGGQPVGQQDDVVRRRAHRLRRREGVEEARAPVRRRLAEGHDRLVHRRAVLRGEPHPVGPRQDRPRPRVEDVQLELRLARHLGGEPVHRPDGVPPLARPQPRLPAGRGGAAPRSRCPRPACSTRRRRG